MPEPFALAHLAVPELPPRSRLFSLAPLGLDTPYVESLTGYLSRLATTHGVQLRHLVKREIATLLGWSGDLSTYLVKTGHLLNGVGLPAARAVDILEGLTGQDRLTYLTLRAWREVLATRGLLRRQLAWCPDCYRDWDAAARPTYEPLLWSITCVKVCPVHSCSLSLRCPGCALDAQPVLAPWSRPGHCARCGTWLGTADGTQQRPAAAALDCREDQWRAMAVGELLASSSTPCTRSHLAAAFQRCAAWCGQSHLGTLARFLQMPRNTVWLWGQGQVVPSLDQLLQVCYRLGVTPRQFLTGNSSAFQADDGGLVRGRTSERVRRPPTPFDVERVRGILEAIVADETVAPSVDAVARQLGCGDRMLYLHLPEQCKAIAARHRDYVTQRGRERVQALCSTIRTIAFDLHNQGIEPTRVRVEERLPLPGILRDPMVREAMGAAINACRAGPALREGPGAN